ncbi:MAG TPA: dienelactone hydrolase family protein [Trueperaceae bacterium]|jgi:predicted esterase
MTISGDQLHAPEVKARAGAPLEGARAVTVLVHGRGDSAHGILGLATVVDAPGVAFLAPEARFNVWYPHTFLAPPEQNEPWLSSALEAVDACVRAATAAGVPRERVVLLGFSQGACLASEYAARQGGRFGGVVALSGGVIGDVVERARYAATLAGTPAFFGCSDVDPYIPVERVHESAALYRELGADVEERIYPGFAHSVNQDEVAWWQGLLDDLTSGA